MIQKFFSIIILFTAVTQSYGIKPREILILEIYPGDLHIQVKSDSDYTKKLPAFRTALIDILRNASPKAKYILIDMYFRDAIGSPYDEAIVNRLKATPNVTFAYGNFAKKEFSHPIFRNAVKEMGHIDLGEDGKENWDIWVYSCMTDVHEPDLQNKCPKDKILRHIALIAAEGYLQTRLNIPLNERFSFPKADLRRFPRITYSDYKNDPDIVKGKLLIVINKPLPDTDMLDYRGDIKISGSEIIANMIQYYIYAYKGK